MSYLCPRALIVTSAAFIFQLPAFAAVEDEWFLDSIGVTRTTHDPAPGNPLVIAIVDDGVRISHEDLRDFIWRNPQELPANGIDDDGNGYVDDINGWDVADANNSVSPPDARLAEFYHGTHLAGIVARIARRAYGDSAPERIRIMPVKSLADRAPNTYLIDGYRGIDYAVAAGADIVLSAWGVAHISRDETEILRNARENGVLVVSSAGNFAEGREQFPAADEGVLAVAALDREDRKTEKSNYGLFVDLAAPGIDIVSTSAISDTGVEAREGTSQSAAMTAAAAAIVKLENDSYSWPEVIACLKNSSVAIDQFNPRYTASLGAGKLNVGAAARCELFDEQDENSLALERPQGYLHFDRRRGKTAAWTITPPGEFKGLRFRPRIVDAAGGTITFFAGQDPGGRMIASHRVENLPESVYVAGTAAHIVYAAAGDDRPQSWLMEYRAEPIDFTRLYCRDTVQLDAEGRFDDGSGASDYSYHSSCKWLITAPEGKVVHIRFTEFETEAQVDKVYFFDGAGTHENVMAIFSGPNIPPELTTWRNQVLVWFVADAENQGRGFSAEYRFVDPE